MNSWPDRLKNAWQVLLVGNYQNEKPLKGEIAFADPTKFFGYYSGYNPSVLVTRKGLEVFDEMRRDDQVKAAMQFKKHAVLSTGWSIVSPKNKPDDWEPTEFVRNQLDKLEGTFSETLLSILTSLDYGYSISEKVYEEKEGKIHLAAIKTKRPHSFRFDVDAFGNLKPDGIIQRQFDGERRLPVGKFILMRHQGEFGNPYGRSDLEAAYRPYWHKTNAYRWLAMCLERYGIPPIFALYKHGTMSPRQIETLKSVLQNIQASTSGAIPRESKETLELWSPELAGQVSGVFLPALDRYDKDIARALLMPGLLGLTNDQVGSQARARVIFDVFMFTIEFLRGVVQERIIMEQVIRQLIPLNFNLKEDEYPCFAFNPLTEDDRESLLATWGNMLGIGAVTKTADDEVHIRSLLGFPEIEVEDIIIEPPVPNESEDSDDDDAEKSDSDKPKENEKQTNAPKKDRSDLRQFAVTRRKKTKAESALIINFKELATSLDSEENLLVLRVARIILEARNRIEDRLLAQGVGIEVVDDLGLEEKLLELVINYFQVLFKKGQRQLRNEISNRVANQQLNNADFDEPEAFRWIRLKADFTVKHLAQRLIEAVRLIILEDLKLGKPVREVIEDLRVGIESMAGTRLRGVQDVRQLRPDRLKTIFRTNATEAFNHGRLIEMRKEKIQKYLNGVQYSAIIDTQTTDICRHLDGRVFRVGDPQLSILTPPNHFNCRSILIPVTPDIAVEEYISQEQIGRAKALAGKGFV